MQDSMVRATLNTLQDLRNEGFNKILAKTSSFCGKHDIAILDMENFYVGGRNRITKKTNRYYFEVEIFNMVMDLQITDFRDRFSETSTQLLEYMDALSPCNAFANFDKTKLINLSMLYKKDFDEHDRIDLEAQLEVFYCFCIKDVEFTSLKGISELAQKMVKKGKHRSYPLVYKLLKLTLILPVATASVERCFSKMKLLKIDLHNTMGNDYLNDALVCNVEKEALMKLDLERVMVRFQAIRERRG